MSNRIVVFVHQNGNRLSNECKPEQRILNRIILFIPSLVRVPLRIVVIDSIVVRFFKLPSIARALEFANIVISAAKTYVAIGPVCAYISTF